MSSAILTDFSSARPTNGAGNLYPYPYLGEDANQSASIVSETLELVVGASSSPYLDFQPYGASGYNSPGGYTSAWIKAGETWDNDFNRMSFAVKCDTTIARPGTGAERTQLGAYNRNPDHTSSSYQGAHPYHFFCNNYYANVWVKHILFNRPSHVVGRDSSINWPPNHPCAYRGRDVDHGSTDQSTWMRILDDDGTTPITSFASISGITFSYQRDQGTGVTSGVTELGSAVAAHTDWGMFHISDGWWRLDLPDAAWATGVAVVSTDATSNVMIFQGVNHFCSASITNTSPNLATESSEVNRGKYFQRLTRFYFDVQGTQANTDWSFDDFRVYEDPDTVTAVEHEIANMTIQYTGTRYEVTWQGLKNLARTYEVRYRLDGLTMRANGFTSGTDGSAVTNTGDDYSGVLWVSGSMAEDTDGIYVAVRVQGETDFVEIFLPYQFGPANDGYAEQYEGGGGGEPEATTIVLGIFN